MSGNAHRVRVIFAVGRNLEGREVVVLGEDPPENPGVVVRWMLGAMNHYASEYAARHHTSAEVEYANLERTLALLLAQRTVVTTPAEA